MKRESNIILQNI